ncbi:MAG: glycosyltransferase family 4 protein [Phycisphaeraceae bacterium]
MKADGHTIAYLINQYPQPSQSFIRREIAALEAQGFAVRRYTVRRWPGDLVDEQDQAERARTAAVLEAGALGLLVAVSITALTRPMTLARALALAVRIGRRSLRGVAYHMIYLAEACVLRRWLAGDGVRHVHAHFGTNSTAVAMLCRALDGPTYSFTVHGPEEFDMPISLALDEKVRRAAFVVTISDFGRSQLFRWADFEDWDRIHVVRCGVDDRFLAGSGGELADTRRLVCVGRLAEQKGQLLLVRAAARLRDAGVDFELVLAGDGPMRAAIEGLVDRLELRERVRITGWVSGEQVRQVLTESRAMVLPSFAEGLPVVIMEALALERPVISTYVAGIPELVEPGVCGWLAPAGSVEALAEAMRAALEAPLDKLQAMGRVGAERVRARHNAATEGARLAALIRAQLAAGEAITMDAPAQRAAVGAAQR